MHNVYRHVTPPFTSFDYLSDNFQNKTPYDSAYGSVDSSPDALGAYLSSSPVVTQNGPMLLPKVRPQDQIQEPVAGMAEPITGPIRYPHQQHRRAVSAVAAVPAPLPSAAAPAVSFYPPYFSTYMAFNDPSALARGRSVSPATQSSLLSPAATCSPQDLAFPSTLNSPLELESAGSSRRHSGFAFPTPNSSSTSLSPPSSLPSVSGGRGRSHCRSVSSSVLEPSVLGRYGYPTYRQLPSYTVSSPAGTGAMPTSAAEVASAHLLNPHPVIVPELQPHQVQSRNHLQVPQLQIPVLPTSSFVPCQTDILPESGSAHYDAAAPVMYAQPGWTDQVSPTTTLMNYLTSANPRPSLVRRIVSNGRGVHGSYWWDVRNLRSWADFTMEHIQGVPGLHELLNVSVNENLLPAVSRPAANAPALQLESEAELHALWRDFHAAKVNAALKTAMGKTHMAMHAQPRSSGAPPRHADFVSNYQQSEERLILGDARHGRIVGLVKAYEAWNSGMRAAKADKQVHYLEGLAQLHRLMREHGCRYGFIATEIELVCVRCGGPPGAGAAAAAAAAAATTSTATSSKAAAKAAAATATFASGGVNAEVPLFGYLELSHPITVATGGGVGTANAAARVSTSTSAPSSSGPELTVGLALWYLHLLAKDCPLPGSHVSWQMGVGPAAKQTRKVCLPRDAWMPKPQLTETRRASRLRGWVWPEEALSRKELQEDAKHKKTKGKK